MSMTKELWEEIELSVMEIRELMEKEEQEKPITPSELSDLAQEIYPISINQMPRGRKPVKSPTQTQRREGGYPISLLNPLGANPKSFEADYWELL